MAQSGHTEANLLTNACHKPLRRLQKLNEKKIDSLSFETNDESKQVPLNKQKLLLICCIHPRPF